MLGMRSENISNCLGLERMGWPFYVGFTCVFWLISSAKFLNEVSIIQNNYIRFSTLESSVKISIGQFNCPPHLPLKAGWLVVVHGLCLVF